MSEYSIRKIDSSAGITDVRFVEYSTILVPKSGGTFTGNVMSPVLSATTISGDTLYGDGSNLTGIPDVYLTGGTYNATGSTITLTRNDDVSVLVTGITQSNGITLQLAWKFSTSTTGSDPSNTRFRYDSSTPSSITEIYLDDLTLNGFDASKVINRLSLNDQVYIQQGDDSTRSTLFNLSGDPVDNGGWWTIPVQYESGGGGGVPANNKDCSFLVLSFGESTDVFVTGGTYANEVITLTRNDAATVEISGITSGTATGLTSTVVVGENVVSGDLVYLNTDSKYWKVNNTSEAASSTELRLVTATILANASGGAIVQGRYTTTGLSGGTKYWVGASGNYTGIQPTGDGDIVRYVGTALSSTELEFNPDEVYIELLSTSPGPSSQPALRNVTTSSSILTNDYTVNVTTSADTTQTLPTAVGVIGKVYNIKNSDTTNTSTVTLVATGGQTMDGETSITYNFPVNITVQSDGSNWILI